MRINIAVCDKDVIFLEKAKKEINIILKEICTTYKISLFLNRKLMLYEVEDNINYDILILGDRDEDISNKIFVKYMRDYLPNIIIVYAVSEINRVFEGFYLNVYRCFFKTEMQELINIMLDVSEKIVKERRMYFIVKNRKGIEKIYLNSIVYIYHEGKYTIFEKIDGTQNKVRKPLKSIYEELDDERFIWVDKGIICNIQYINKIEGDKIILDGKKEVLMCKYRSNELKKNIYEKWMDEKKRSKNENMRTDNKK